MLYSIAVFTENEAAINASYFSDADTHSAGYLTDQSSALYSHTNPNVNVVYDLSNTSFPETKDYSKSFKTIIAISDQIENRKFRQYSFFTICFPIPFSRPDIVFPFHYFL